MLKQKDRRHYFFVHLLIFFLPVDGKVTEAEIIDRESSGKRQGPEPYEKTG
jgi:hypothetical protein